MVTNLSILAIGNHCYKSNRFIIIGNSHIDNPHAPRTDPEVITSFYQRTPEHNSILGLQHEELGEGMYPTISELVAETTVMLPLTAQASADQAAERQVL